MLPRACRSVAALSMMMGLAAASHASDWGTVPAISSTMGVHDGRVCVGEATRGDIGCPTYAPEVGTDGSISASRFVGDGSGLTGVVASTADRIVSGTTSLLAVSGTGFVSLTQAGTNTGWFDPTRGLVTLGVSATGGISGSSGYFSGPVGIGQTPTTHALSISGTLNVDGANTLRLGHQYHYIRRNGTANEYMSSAGHFFGGTWGGTLRLRNADALFYGKTFIGDGASQPSAIRSSLFVAGTTWITSWTIVNANTTPTAPLEVSGTVSATRFVGDGSGLTGLNASTDRLVSGSAALILSPTGVLSLNGRLELNSGTGVVGIGSGAAAGSQGSYVVGIGSSAGQYTGGSNVTFVGAFAGQYNSSSYVTGLGYGAARYNSGTYITAVGNSAGYANNSIASSFLGYAAGERNTGSSYVTALGYYAGQSNAGSQLTAVGANAAWYNTGNFVNALGFAAARNNTGSYVEAVGYNAAISNTGSNVVAIGRDAAKVNTFSNVVALGYNAQPDKANQVVLGDSSIVEVSTAGVILARGVSTTGTVTATRFVGDGSGLTGVVASTADRIVSGTTSMVAVSSTGFVSLTQAGTNTGWFDPTRGLVTLGVSATGGISATTGYMGNLNVANNALVLNRLGVGSTTVPTYALDVVGAGRFYNPSANTSVDIGRQGDNIAYNALNIWSAYNATWPTWVMNQGFAGAVLYTSHHTMILRVGSSPAAPSVMNLLSTQRVGISNTAPQATLDVGGNVIVSSSAAAAVNVYGTVSASYVKLADNNNLPCTPERYGTLRFSNGIVSVCRAP